MGGQDYANGFQVQENGVTKITAPTALDFGAGFTITESPSGVAQIEFDDGGGGTDVPVATTTTFGTVKLSVAAASADNPIAVGDNDPRNSDDRFPTHHHETHEAGGDDIVVFAQSQVTDLTSDLAERLQGYTFFGTGEDGNVTISVDTTLTKDMHYNVLTINTGIKLIMAGYRVFAFEIAGAGSLVDVGLDATGATALPARAAGYLPAPTKGANGGAIGANGSNGVAVSNSIGAIGVAGKNSASHTGGNAGAATALAASSGGVRNFVNIMLFRAFAATSLVSFLGNGGNGGSAGGTASAGGASGNNGGYAAVFARKISGTITIDVRGGAGGNAGGTGGTDGAGGTGGNGGVIGFIYHQVTGSITHLYTGGAGGTGYVSGDTGNTGMLISLQI